MSAVRWIVACAGAFGIGGAFPTELAWQRIDGRPLSFDSDREMPLWGRDLRHEALAHPYFRREPEAYVASQIDAVIDHLKRMQMP